jgi:hypothetical protein
LLPVFFDQPSSCVEADPENSSFYYICGLCYVAGYSDKKKNDACAMQVFGRKKKDTCKKLTDKKVIRVVHKILY